MLRNPRRRHAAREHHGRYPVSTFLKSAHQNAHWVGENTRSNCICSVIRWSLVSIASLQCDRGFEPAKTHVIRSDAKAFIVRHFGQRKSKGLGVALRCHAINNWPARISQIQKFGDLVKGLTGRIVPCGADELVVAKCLNNIKLSVATRDNDTQMRIGHIIAFQVDRVEMAFDDSLNSGVAASLANDLAKKVRQGAHHQSGCVGATKDFHRSECQHRATSGIMAQ